MKKLIIIFFITIAILFQFSCSHKVNSDEWMSRLNVDSTTSLDHISLIKFINHSSNRKFNLNIISDSVNKLIKDNKNKYISYYIGFGLEQLIILENNMYYKLKNLLLDYALLENSKVLDFDSSKLLIIHIFSNYESYIEYEVDLNNDYDNILKVFKTVFNDDQISRFSTYLNENRD